MAIRYKSEPSPKVGKVKRPKKEQITLRIDPDILEYFRASGYGWQRRLNDWLRTAMRTPEIED